MRRKTIKRTRRTGVAKSWRFTLFGLVLLVATSCNGDGGGSGDGAPAAPSNVQATAQPGYVQVAWEDNSDDETGFAVYRASVEGADGDAGDFTRLGEVGADTTQYRDSAAQVNQTYLYSVTALGREGESAQVQTDPSEPVTPEPGEPQSDTLTLSILLDGPGRGTVSSQDGSLNCSEPGAAGCTASFPVGTALTLSADAGAGAEFAGWSGEGCSGAGTCDLTLNAESDSNDNGSVEVTVTFAQTGYGLLFKKEGSGSGTFKSTPGGIDCGSDCEEAYDLAADKAVKVGFASADITLGEGSLFNAWGGDCPDSDASTSCTVTMDENRTVVAYLSKPANDSYSVQNGQPLTVDAATGLLSNDLLGGAEAGSDLNVATDPISPPQNGRVTLQADGSFTYTPNAGFDGTDKLTYRVTDLRDNTAQATVTLNVSATPQVTLTVEKQGAGTGTVSSQPAGITCGDDCSQAYAVGTSVSLSASAAEGSTFAGWGGACSGSDACEVTLDEAKTVTATFATPEPQPFTLTVTKAGDGAGTVTSQPSGISCGVDCLEGFAAGTTVSLRADPAEGSSFESWSGACSGDAACSVTMSQAQRVTATFVPAQPANQPPTAQNRTVTVPQGASKPLILVAEDLETPAGELTYTIVEQPDKGRLESDDGDNRVIYTANENASGDDSFTFSVSDAQNEPVGATMSLIITNRLVVKPSTNGQVTALNTPAPAGNCKKEVGDPGPGEVSDLCGDYRVGANVTLQAQPDEGFVFSGWQGACDGAGSATCTLTMDSAKTTSATFIPQPAQMFEVSVRVNGAAGRVVSDPAGIDCFRGENENCTANFVAGTQVTLEAAPAGITSAFRDWRRDCRGEELTCTLNMTENKDVVARFQGNNLQGDE